jgi:hypothetical protein
MLVLVAVQTARPRSVTLLSGHFSHSVAPVFEVLCTSFALAALNLKLPSRPSPTNSICARLSLCQLLTYIVFLVFVAPTVEISAGDLECVQKSHLQQNCLNSLNRTEVIQRWTEQTSIRSESTHMGQVMHGCQKPSIHRIACTYHQSVDAGERFRCALTWLVC